MKPSDIKVGRKYRLSDACIVEVIGILPLRGELEYMKKDGTWSAIGIEAFAAWAQEECDE